MPCSAAVRKPKWAYHPGSPSRTTDGSPALVGRDEHRRHERRADALALVVGVHRDRAQRDRGPLPHRRPAADEVPDDLTVQVGDQGQGVEDVALVTQPVQDPRLERVLGTVGYPERQVVQGPGGLQVVRALPAQDEVTVHGVILSAWVGRASEYCA